MVGLKDERGRTIKKVYEKAKTPYQRILECPDVSENVKKGLREQQGRLSLVELKKRLDELLVKLLEGRLRNKQRRFQGQNYDLTNNQLQGHGILI